MIRMYVCVQTCVSVTVETNELGQVRVAHNDGRLVGGLIGEVARLAVTAADARAALAVVDGAHVERRVARVVARIGVAAVVDQVVEVVGEAELARVVYLLPVVGVLEADGRAVEEQVLDALHRGGVQDGQVERRESARVHHFGERAQLEQCLERLVVADDGRLVHGRERVARPEVKAI